MILVVRRTLTSSLDDQLSQRRSHIGFGITGGWSGDADDVEPDGHVGLVSAERFPNPPFQRIPSHGVADALADADAYSRPVQIVASRIDNQQCVGGLATSAEHAGEIPA